MKKGSKILSIAVSLALTAGLMAGCGAQKEEPANSSTATVTEKSTVKMEAVRLWTNEAPQKEFLTAQFDEFNNTIGKEKGIQVELRFFGSDYGDAIKLAMTAGEGPELFKRSLTLDQHIAAKHIVPLDDFPGAKEWLKGYEGKLQPVLNIVDDKTYSVPFTVFTSKMVYNKDLFAKAGITEFPKTWEGVREAAKKITQMGDGKEFGYAIALKETGMMKWEISALMAPSVGHMGFDFKKGKYSYIDFKPVLEIMLQMQNEGSMFPGIVGLGNDAARAQFAEGKIGIKASAAFDSSTFASQFVPKMEWGVANVPALDEKNRYKEFAQLGDQLVMGVAANNMPEKAFEVFKYYQGDAMLTKMYEKGTVFPYKNDIINMAKSTPATKNYKEYADTSLSYFTMQMPDGLLKLEGDPFNNVLQKILSGASADIGKELEDLDKRYNAALEKAKQSGAIDMKLYVDDKLDLKLN